MGSLQESLHSAEAGLEEVSKDTEAVSEAVSEMHTQVLEFYSGYEDAKAHVNRLKDPK